jgi:cytochrome c556
MKSKSLMLLKTHLIVLALLVCAGVSLNAAPEKKEAASQQAAQKGFDTAQQAADALIQAAEAFDVAALREILGPGSEDIVSSQDPVQDKSRAAEFATKAKEKQSVEVDAKNANSAILLIGNDEWPLPIPIVKRNAKWYFDAKAGRVAILLRRIGANELDVIEICRGFVEAQQEYAAEKHDNATVNQYAQKMISTPGKQDGLAWKNPDGTWGGPVGEEVAQALEQGYSDKAQPYHGYYFKVLKGQGPDAPMGEMDFMVGGAMIGGFALVAAPAEYKVTGVQTFMVSHAGIVYEKDLGPETLTAFKSIERFNPDNTWKATDDQW